MTNNQGANNSVWDRITDKILNIETKMFKYDFYEELRRSTRFNTFWLFVSISVLSVIMGINASVLGEYSSGFANSKRYDWSDIRNVFRFPIEQLEICDGSFVEKVDALVEPNNGKYLILVDKTRSVNIDALISRDVDKFNYKPIVNSFKNDEIVSSNIDKIGSLEVVALFVGRHLVTKMGVPESLIEVKYFQDQKNDASIDPYKCKDCVLTDKHKTEIWYKNLLEDENSRIDYKPNSIRDKSMFKDLFDEIFRKELKENNYEHVLMLTDLDLVKEDSVSLKNLFQTINRGISDGVHLNMIQLESNNANSKKFDTTFDILINELSKVNVSRIESSTIESIFNGVISDKNTSLLSRTLAHTYFEADKEFLMIGENISDLVSDSISHSINFELNDSASVSLVVQGKEVRNVLVESKGTYSNLVHLQDSLVFVKDNIYKIPLNRRLVEHRSNDYRAKSFIDFYFKKSHIKKRYQIKQGRKLDKGVIKVWLYSLATVTTTLLSILFSLVFYTSIRRSFNTVDERPKFFLILLLNLLFSFIGMLVIWWMCDLSFEYISEFIWPFLFITLFNSILVKFDLEHVT